MTRGSENQKLAKKLLEVRWGIFGSCLLKSALKVQENSALWVPRFLVYRPFPSTLLFAEAVLGGRQPPSLQHRHHTRHTRIQNIIRQYLVREQAEGVMAGRELEHQLLPGLKPSKSFVPLASLVASPQLLALLLSISILAKRQSARFVTVRLMSEPFIN